jgi:hypothetical protein
MAEKKQEEKVITREEAEQTLIAMRDRGLQECNARVQAAMQGGKYQLVGIPRWVPDGMGGWRTVIDVQIRET